MELDFTEHSPADFSSLSRTWVYPSSRILSMAEAFDLSDQIKAFTLSWKSHGQPVKGFANLFFGQFLVIMADETRTTVSGCSTDQSVHFVQQMETLFGVRFFDRQLLDFWIKEKVERIPLPQLSPAWQHGFIGPDTLFFNHLVSTKKEWEEKWLVPVKDSWLMKRLATTPQTS